MVVAHTPKENITALTEFFETVPHSEIFLQVKKKGVLQQMSYRDLCNEIGFDPYFIDGKEDASGKNELCWTLCAEDDGSITVNRDYLDLCTEDLSIADRQAVRDSVYNRVLNAGFVPSRLYAAQHQGQVSDYEDYIRGTAQTTVLIDGKEKKQTLFDVCQKLGFPEDVRFIVVSGDGKIGISPGVQDSDCSKLLENVLSAGMEPDNTLWRAVHGRNMTLLDKAGFKLNHRKKAAWEKPPERKATSTTKEGNCL